MIGVLNCTNTKIVFVKWAIVTKVKSARYVETEKPDYLTLWCFVTPFFIDDSGAEFHAG